MGADSQSEQRRQHDIKSALLLLKQLAELLEGGFTPTDSERQAIAKQLKKAYDILKEQIQ